MGFFGMSSAGKQAGAFAGDWGNWSKDQAEKNWIPQSQQASTAGTDASNDYLKYMQDRANKGIGSVADINGYGSQIMPGVQQYQTDAMGRIQQNQGAATGVADKLNTLNTQNRGEIDAANNSNLKDIELMKPGGQFQVAQAARANSGAVSSAAANLRRMGLDPNSPQAVSLMSQMRTGQGRAMDDAAANGTAQYVNARANQANNTLNAYGQNEATAANNTQAAYATSADLNNQLNSQQLQNIGVGQQQFNAGQSYVQADQASKDTGAQGVGNYGQNMLNYGVQASNQAQDWGNQATNSYNTQYQREAANAGWGLKALGGIAGAALNVALPGSGAISSGIKSIGGAALGGLTGSGSPAPAYGQPASSGATPPFVPYGPANPYSSGGSPAFVNPRWPTNNSYGR